jgi:hypothetical protein
MARQLCGRNHPFRLERCILVSQRALVRFQEAARMLAEVVRLVDHLEDPFLDLLAAISQS